MYFGSDFQTEGLQSTNETVYWNVRKKISQVNTEKYDDNVVALTDLSDISKVPSEDDIRRINYDRDKSLDLFRNSNVRIVGAIHYVYVMRLFLENFIAPANQAGGKTAQINLETL